MTVVQSQLRTRLEAHTGRVEVLSPDCVRLGRDTIVLAQFRTLQHVESGLKLLTNWVPQAWERIADALITAHVREVVEA